MGNLTHRPRRSTAVLVALAALALSLAVISRPIVPARADDSQDVTIAQAAAQAAETGQAVLATAETTETSSVVANPDGTLTATLGAGPLQEPDPSSDTGWSPIDLTLQHVDGTYAPAVSAADTTFSDGGSGALATLDQGSTTYTETWDGTLPTPTVSGTTATYANVLPNIDIVMTAQTTGFKQSFVVKVAPTHQLTLDVPLSLRGLTATVDDNGNLIVTDAGGNTVATAGTAVMYGAAVGPTGEPTISATVDTQVVNGQHGPVFEISPDASFFTNPELTYPVTIDPSPNLDVTYDTYVRESTPTTSYLTENGLKVGLVASSDKTRALLKFPALDATYRGNSNAIDVSSATLNLHEADSGSCTASEIDLYNVTSNWITATPVNWSNQPTIGTLYASASFAYGHSGSCPAQTVGISTGGASGHTLADLVQNWADGTSNYGLELKAANESVTSDYKKFRSSEYGSNPPTLSVTYVESLVCPSPSSATELGDARDSLCATQLTADSYSSGGVDVDSGTETVGEVTANYKEIPLYPGDESGDNESDYDTLVTSQGVGEYPAGSLVANFPGEASYDDSLPIGFLVEPDNTVAPAIDGLTPIGGSKRCGQISSDGSNQNLVGSAFRYKPTSPPGGSTSYRVVFFGSGSAHGGNWDHHILSASARSHVLASNAFDVWSPDDSTPYGVPTSITTTLSATWPGGSGSVGSTHTVYPAQFGVQYISLSGSRYYFGWDGDKGCGGGTCEYIGIRGGYQFDYTTTYPDYNQWLHIDWPGSG